MRGLVYTELQNCVRLMAWRNRSHGILQKGKDMRKIKIAVAPALAAGLLAAGAASAHAAPMRTRYVSPSGQSGARDASCRTAGYSSINAAIAAAVSRRVTVCRGVSATISAAGMNVTMLRARSLGLPNRPPPA